jgi:hypothetical protein
MLMGPGGATTNARTLNPLDTGNGRVTKDQLD